VGELLHVSASLFTADPLDGVGKAMVSNSFEPRQERTAGIRVEGFNVAECLSKGVLEHVFDAQLAAYRGRDFRRNVPLDRREVGKEELLSRGAIARDCRLDQTAFCGRVYHAEHRVFAYLSDACVEIIVLPERGASQAGGGVHK
jgi:hypothetical protein